ncbi:MAG TPA: nucleoside-diphosphate sugar epimerase/dehydratase [Acidimicrobiia bacterium]|nr:nucleoside-diphosphate sugar epimerase/dehydratase [Acidimicrobiia bacterium]
MARPKPGALGFRITRAGAQIRADLSFAVIDALLIVMAYTTALGLRFWEESSGIPPKWFEGFVAVIPAILAVHLIANIAFGTYGHVWEYASVAEAVRMVAAAATAAVAILAAVLVSREVDVPFGPIPVGVVALGSMLTLAGMGAVRFRSRMFSFKRLSRPPESERTLIVGTGRAAAELARRMPFGTNNLIVTGFVSVIGHHPRLLAGLPVLGTIDEIDRLVAAHAIDQVIVAGTQDDRMLRKLVDRCVSTDVRLRIIPDIDASLNGQGPLGDVRDLELTDLLPRPEVFTDLAGVRDVLAGKRILVTGAGGSIGAEIVRQVLAFEPAEVVALDHDETHLFDAGIIWSRRDGLVHSVLCDIRDREALLKQFVDWRPHVVFHAAAHKHVPILELCPAEAVKTNVLATENVLEAARSAGVERFVLISTDKAVRPASVMGASKRVAEMMMRAAAIRNPACRFSAVRFGNVLGSRGSVIPTFLDQIRRGGPVTVTDPEMVRYFMTVGEAVQLVLQASALTTDGETFVLDMGEPVRIIDLAHRLIRLAGLVPGRHIQVEMVGARPGEKLREVLTETELRPALHPKIKIADPPFPGPITVLQAVDALRKQVNVGSAEALKKSLLELAQGEWVGTEVLSLPIFEESIQWG